MSQQPATPLVLLSVVSHDQSQWAEQFLADLNAHEPGIEVVFTHNTQSEPPRWPEHWHVLSIHNTKAKGFAANHNHALKGSRSPFVCVANPDIRLPTNPFPALLEAFDDPSVGLVVPQVLNPQGEVDDSVRRFPTPWCLVRKLFGRDDGRILTDSFQAQAVPWAAGMFMLFRKEAFDAVGGFDEGFHLYYEDVDICARLWQSGWHVVHQPRAKVVHHAQRASRKDWRFFRWHIASMTRFFVKHVWHTRCLERMAAEAASKDTPEAQ